MIEYNIHLFFVEIFLLMLEKEVNKQEMIFLLKFMIRKRVNGVNILRLNDLDILVFCMIIFCIYIED